MCKQQNLGYPDEEHLSHKNSSSFWLLVQKSHPLKYVGFLYQVKSEEIKTLN